ncbi:MAG: Mfa1 family fimbria major subunit, partial [Muribaculaceae bacterium]|nr:Mfa1 family fimbria major subunit [Muribaculaceae bacterium]
MKTKQLLIGAFALLSLAACSDDKDPGFSPSNGAQKAKITLDIMSAGSLSRAQAPDDDQFEFGTAAESEIKSAVIVFYDSQKNPMQAIPVPGSDFKGNETSAPNEELRKKVELEVALANGQYPSFVMVYVNPINSADVDFALTPEVIATKTRDKFMGDANSFAMNNSVYFAEDGTLMREVAVSKENFYQTEAEKEAAPEVKIHIERVAGKVTLKPSTGTDLGTQEGEISGKKLVFTPVSWGVNAVAKKFYLIKRFSYTNEAPTLAWLEENFKSFFVNHPGYYRSYWAVSPHYAFPMTGDKIDVSKYPYVSDDVENDNYLRYFSWNQFTGNVESGSRKIEIGKSTYTMENTVHSTMYNTQQAEINKNAALVSAVVLGQYTVDGENVDFYVFGGNIYLEQDYIKAMAKLVDQIVVHADGTPLTDKEGEADDLNAIFEIKHPKTNIGGLNKDQVEENKVTIQLKSSVDKAKYAYNNGGETPVAITDANLAEINEKIQTLCGLASAYTKGMAYFNVPIRHLGSRASEDAAWPAGSFGVVRNHSYVISVDGFADLSTATLGHGVLDPDKP